MLFQYSYTISEKLKKFQEIESTVLLFVSSSARSRQLPFANYIKFLKGSIQKPEFILQPFVTSVLLNISEIFEHDPLVVLQLAILREINENELRRSSCWMKKISANIADTLNTIDTVLLNW